MIFEFIDVKNINLKFLISEGSLLEGMAIAVESSACILVCFSAAYQTSDSCRTGKLRLPLISDLTTNKQTNTHKTKQT